MHTVYYMAGYVIFEVMYDICTTISWASHI